MSKTRNGNKARSKVAKAAQRVSASDFQDALDALAGLDKDAQRSGADGLTVAQINKLIRSTRAAKRGASKGKSA